MKGRTRIILTTCLALIFLSAVFPPWLYTVDANGEYGGHTRKPAGYAFIAAPPAPQFNNPHHGVVLDYSRLLVEWVAVGAALALALVCVPILTRRSICFIAAIGALVCAGFVVSWIRSDVQHSQQSALHTLLSDEQFGVAPVNKGYDVLEPEKHTNVSDDPIPAK